MFTRMRRSRESYPGGEPTPLATTVEMKATMAISGRHWNAPDISATRALPVGGARTVPQHSADGGTVAFAKNGQAQCIAKGIFHRLSPRFP